MPSVIPAAIGSFPGSVTVSYQWRPDPEVIAQELISIAGYLDNMAAPLAASKAVAQADMHERFASDSGPNGEAWMPLDTEYAVWKASVGGDPNDILTLTGALEAAATSEAAYTIDARNLWFNAGALPYYGLWNDQGTGGPDVWHMQQDMRERVEAGVGGAKHASLGIGRGHALPARPFIGLSAEAEAEIFGIFDMWFYEGTQWHGGGGISMGSMYRADPRHYYVHPGGTVQTRVAGGRFGPKIDTVIPL